MIKMLEIGDGIPILQTIKSHTTDVTSCDFGAKFQLATGSGDKTINVWEWQVGKGYVKTNYSPLKPHKYAVTCVRFSPQGTMLATSSIDGSTVLWNVGTGIRIATFVQPSGVSVRTCRFSPDSTSLATADDDGAVVLWDLVLRNLVRTIQHLERSVVAIAFTPDSKYLLTTCNEGVMKLWDAVDRIEDSSNCLATVEDAHDLGVMGCDFSPAHDMKTDERTKYLQDTYLLATGGNDHLIKLWMTSVGRKEKHAQKTPCTVVLRQILTGHNSAVSCVQFSPAGTYLASTSIDKTTRIWETVNGNCLTVLEGHTRYVFSCSFSRDGSLLATGSNDKTLIVWDLTKNLTLDSVLTPPSSAASSLHVNLAGACGGPCSNRNERDVVKHAERDTNEVKMLQRLENHGSGVNSVHFHGNTLLATGCGDKLVRLWSSSGERRFKELPISPIKGHKYSVNQVEFSPDGRMLASCSVDGSTVLWDTQTGKRAKPSFQCSSSGIRTCRFSPDGHLLATAGDENITTVFNTHAMELVMNVEGHSDSIDALSFTPDSQYLVTASADGYMKLWSVAPCSEECRLTIDAHDLGAQSCDFSPIEGTADSERGSVSRYLLASCGNDSLVKLWHIFTPRYYGENRHAHSLWKTFTGHGGNVMCVRFASGSGDIIGSTATDHTARLWNVYTGECVHVLENHNTMVNTCAFSADSSLFATGSMDKTVFIWELPPQLVFQTVAAVRLRGYRKRLMDWTVEDVQKWLKKWRMENLSDKLKQSRLNGQQLLTLSETKVLEILKIGDKSTRETFALHLFWLKKEDAGLVEVSPHVQIPHEFLCPITHEIMRDPVTCSDGFTYEQAAINEWFLSGKFTSPMTNASLTDTTSVANIELLKQICLFLYGDNRTT